MAGTDRHENTAVTLVDSLVQKPYQFGFYEALRQLECLYRDKPRLGQSVRPGDDAVRLGQTPSLQFAPSTLAEASAEEDRALKLKVFFFGLFGPNGPLPLHLTEFAQNRIRDAKDPTFADFADLFHHRLLSLFYRAWADKEPTVQLDRPEQDRFAFYVGALLGLADPALRQRDNISDHAKLHFAAHLGCQRRHREGLESILMDYFKVPVQIQEFIGEWLDIPKQHYGYLLQTRGSAQLGVTALIGVRTWQCQNKFRIIIGPLTWSEYQDFLPVGQHLKKLQDLVNLYVGLELNWEINLILKAPEVPALQLGSHARLGWTSWLHAGIRTLNVNDLYLAREKII